MNRKIEIRELIALSQKEQYVGYLWVSDKKEPKEYHNPSDVSVFLKDFADDKNPFIIEGQLYSEVAKKSYSIKYVDGNYIIVEYGLKNTPNDWANLKEKDLKKFIPNRIAASKIVFLQFWEPVKDEFCLNMEVLQPAALAFVGFEYETKKEKEGK